MGCRKSLLCFFANDDGFSGWIVRGSKPILGAAIAKPEFLAQLFGRLRKITRTEIGLSVTNLFQFLFGIFYYAYNSKNPAGEIRYQRVSSIKVRIGMQFL